MIDMNSHPSPQNQTRDSRQGRGNLLMTLTLAATLTACGLLLWEKRPPQSVAQVDREVTPRGELAAAEKAVIQLFRRASPSVVHIKTTFRTDRFGTISETPHTTCSAA